MYRGLLSVEVMKHNEPLGLPKGSIRGLLSLIIVTGWVVMNFLVFCQLEASIEQVADLWKLPSSIGIVITFYYTSRIYDKKNGNNGK